MTHEDIVQESKKYWQQMEAHASKPANSMVRCILGSQPGFASGCSSTFSLLLPLLCLTGPRQTRLATEAAESFPVCSASDDRCTSFCSVVSAQFSGGEKPPEQGGQSCWCFQQHLAGETRRPGGSWPHRVGIKGVLLPFSGRRMIWQVGRTQETTHDPWDYSEHQSGWNWQLRCC